MEIKILRGPGGIGKTKWALEFKAEREKTWPQVDTRIFSLWHHVRGVTYIGPKLLEAHCKLQQSILAFVGQKKNGKDPEDAGTVLVIDTYCLTIHEASWYVGLAKIFDLPHEILDFSSTLDIYKLAIRSTHRLSPTTVDGQMKKIKESADHLRAIFNVRTVSYEVL